MMCLACRKAGAENQRCEQEGVDFETVEKDLKKLHKRCAWPGTCTCQHQVGEGHLNLPPARPLRADALDDNPENDDGDLFSRAG